jgi:Rrf2 family nitric oxide-sensitive transcriptional repressor
MRLTYYSDYSLRVLMYLATNRDHLVTIQEIADAYGISKNHLMKVAFELGKKGFLETVRGRNGGLRLAKDPAQIKLGNVVRATEDDFTIVECFDQEKNTCPITAACRLRGALSKALLAYLAVLDEYTLADLTQRNAPLVRLLQAS